MVELGLDLVYLPPNTMILSYSAKSLALQMLGADLGGSGEKEYYFSAGALWSRFFSEGF